ncbi:30S ribosome-binding factor RbfA [Helicobacter sp. MIT 21-1697]|uniref:30S ribosome-binding factor RbfA n=1 Tax=Helicobacter sp. MIT 21-1697 TaxID=2993733 RepID=UPI00224AA417|nr:30S ribosome-binding factor RbfA [Helicobacter sp. MIT 21-1697]MCX2716963.1 30S ribosome-binding factor RbfA [Helicobacter sp. MIT 21-1697]
MNIKQQRLESLLQEILSEALSQLNDVQINTLSITGVKCSKGKQSAEVYIEGTDIPAQEREAILARLHKAQGILKEYVLTSTQWFRSPNFSFKFDDSLRYANTLDTIFEQIAKNRHH